MNNEEQDDLWELLGRAKAPVASPFFSRNVLRAIREEEQEKPGFFFWLRSHWQVAAISTCAVAIAASFAFVQQAHQPDPELVLAQEVSVSPDYQVISNLDELLDTERNSIWLEASLN
jgi:hypothetical protein